MTITITLTSAGSDSGPFDIYGNSTGSFVLITSGVSRLSLTSGYTTAAPDGTTVVRVQSTGTCTNYEDINIQTTTTTTTPPTSYAWNFSSPGRSSSNLACAETTFPQTWYTSVNALDVGVVVYTSPSLDTAVGSGNLWYLEGINGLAYRIDNAGNIVEVVACTPQTDCYQYEAVVAVNDLQNSQDGMVHFVYSDCNGDTQEISLTEEGTWPNAFCATGFIGAYYVNQSNVQTSGLSFANSTLQLCNTTTTTTTAAPTYTALPDSRWSSISHAEVCSNFPGTLYSNCVAMEANQGCYLYTDQNGTPLLGYPYVYLQALGAIGNWDVTPQTGEVINYAPVQC